MFKILIIVRSTVSMNGVSVHTSVVEFTNKGDADVAFEKLRASDSPKNYHSINAVKMY